MGTDRGMDYRVGEDVYERIGAGAGVPEFITQIVRRDDDGSVTTLSGRTFDAYGMLRSNVYGRIRRRPPSKIATKGGAS